MLYDADWLYQRCLDISDVPLTHEQMDRARWDRHLTEAQIHWYEQIALYVPEALLSGRAWERMTTEDNITFSVVCEPVGEMVVIPRMGGDPLIHGPEWQAGTEYVREGNGIRMPHNRPRHFADGPYARYVPALTSEINGSAQPKVEPVLLPARARVLLPYRACILYASQGGLRNPAYYQNLEDEVWFGDPSRGKPGLLDQLIQQYRGVYGYGGAGRKWYRSPDLGT